MKLLLDTHVWLWLLTRPELVPAAAREAVGDGRTSTYLSTVCVWEIALKHALGKLSLPTSPAVLVAESLAGATLVTGDPKLAAYDAPILWD